MASNVSLDDLEKRMKKLELNLKKENVESRRSPSLGLNFEQVGIKPIRPNSGNEPPRMTHSRNRSTDLGLSFDQSYPGRTRPSSALDLPTLAGSTQSRGSNLGLNFTQDPNAVRLSRPSSGLDLTSSGRNSPALQRKKQIAFQLPTQVEPAKNYESVEVDRRLQEVIMQNGKLRIGKQLFRADASHFENLGEIGAGTCGQVYKMRFKPANHIMAVKQMHRSGNNEESKRILMDLDIVQKSHDCPHIVTCYGTLLTESHVWICMELMSTCFDKLLKKIKGPIPERIIGKLTVAVVKALNYLKESQGVMHRDVKPSNILVDRNGTVKLCDFGISGRLVDSKAKTRTAGCAAYMAPERIDPPDPTRPDYDIRADVWSLGVSLVELATGIFPYANCTTDFEVLTKVLQQASPTLPQNLNFSIHFQQFVKLCCTKDYTKRPKYRTLLEHEFIKLYERSSIDIAAWLNGVLQPPPAVQPSRNPFFNGRPEPAVRPAPVNDPFAFTAAATQAQFAQYRTAQNMQNQTSTPLPVAAPTKRILTVDDLLS